MSADGRKFQPEGPERSGSRELRAVFSRLASACAASLFLYACMPSADAPPLRAGVLDLSAWNFAADGIVPVAGEWQICWGQLVAPGSGDCPGRGWQLFPAPRLWSDSSVSSPVGGRGVASYRATLELPADAGGLTLRVGSPLTAYRLWIDGEDRGGVGRVGTTPGTTVAKLENRLYALPRGARRVELLVHVANFEFRGGGLRREWYLGLDQQVYARTSYELLLYAMFATSSLVIGLVFLVQFAFRTSERARGWFGLFAILVGLRILSASSGDLYQLMVGWAPFGLLIRVEYLNTSLLIAVGLLYLRDKVPGVMPHRLTQLLALAALALVPIQLFAPLDAVLATITPILALPPLVLLVTIASYGRAARRGLPGAASTLVVGLAFSVGTLHDVVRTQTGWGAPIELFPYFVVAFIVSESRSLLRAFARSFATAEQLSLDLQDSNFDLQETEEAVVRFVPFDLLRMLGKQSIRDISAGDHVEADVTVLSCDLHVAESDSTATRFARLNDLLAKVEPAIRARNGFVIGPLHDRIVALFPRSADDAVEAALDVERAVREFRRTASPQGADASLGVGIATGAVLLGTVGDHESLASLVAGAPVDLARRLHERAKSNGSAVLIARSTRDALGPRSRHALREAGSIDLPGRSERSPVFELVDGGGPG